MIFIYSKDPQLCSYKYKRKYLKTCIQVYLGYLIGLWGEDYWGKWIRKRPDNYRYLLFLTHYLIGRYQREKDPKRIKIEDKLIDFLLDLFSKQDFKVKGSLSKRKGLPEDYFKLYEIIRNPA